MKLLFIRHGDPDYENDCLTLRGEAQAKALKEYLKIARIDRAFLSPLGRAQQTAKIALCGRDIPVETLEFLQEFLGWIEDPQSGKRTNFWEFLWGNMPSVSAEDPALFDPCRWKEAECMKNSTIPAEFTRVTGAFDALLSRYGLKRTGAFYRAEGETADATLAFFMHFGISTVFLSHITGVSLAALNYHFYAQPSSITTLESEPFEGGVRFVCRSYGSLGHLHEGEHTL